MAWGSSLLMWLGIGFIAIVVALVITAMCFARTPLAGDDHHGPKH